MLNLMSDSPRPSFRQHGGFWVGILAAVVVSLSVAGLLYLAFGTGAAALLLVLIIGAGMTLGIR